MTTDARISCGRAIGRVGAVTMDTNGLSNNCGAGDFHSQGYSGGLTIGDAAPESAAWAMMLLGLAAVGAVARRRRRAGQSHGGDPRVRVS